MPSFFDFLTLLLSSAGLAGLIGLERELRIQKYDISERSLGGLRTYAMVGSLGFLSIFLADYVSSWFLFLIFGAVILIAVISHALLAYQEKRMGMTSLFSLLASFLIGVLVAKEELVLALSISILFSSLLVLREVLHNAAKQITNDEFLSLIKFLILSFIVLQVLPTSWIDPFDFFDWRPRTIWLMVMLVAAIRFIGYFLSKFIGKEKSTLLSGIVGGLVSSTAVTTSLSQDSKGKRETDLFLIPILVASGIMFFRVIFEISIITKNLQNFLPLLFILALMGFISILAGVFLIISRGKSQESSIQQPEISQPLHMRSALSFGVFFLIILILSEKIGEYFADGGMIVVGAIAGLTDVDAITLAMAGKDNTSFLPSLVIFVAVVVNTLVKVGIVGVFGSKELFKKVSIIITFCLIAGIGAFGMFFFWI